MVHGCLRVGEYVCGWHIYSQICASFTYFGELLRCPHKHIVNMMKVYIERKNIQVELIRFRKKYQLYSHLLFRIELFRAISLTELNSTPDNVYCH